jgi:hypothetical protein
MKQLSHHLWRNLVDLGSACSSQAAEHRYSTTMNIAQPFLYKLNQAGLDTPSLATDTLAIPRQRC